MTVYFGARAVLIFPPTQFISKGRSSRERSCPWTIFSQGGLSGWKIVREVGGVHERGREAVAEDTVPRGACGCPGDLAERMGTLETFQPQAWSSPRSPQLTPCPTSHPWLHRQHTGGHR